MVKFLFLILFAVASQASQVSGPSSSGTVGGTVGATDNVMLRSDGTGGSTIQGSTVTLGDTGAMVNQLTSDVVGLKLKANTGGQTNYLLEVYRSNGDRQFTIDNNGSVITGGDMTVNNLKTAYSTQMDFSSTAATNAWELTPQASTAWNSMLFLRSPNAATRALTLKAAASQSENIFEVRADDNSVLCAIQSDGSLTGACSGGGFTFNTDLIPDADVAYDIGSSASRVQDIFSQTVNTPQLNFVLDNNSGTSRGYLATDFASGYANADIGLFSTRTTGGVGISIETSSIVNPITDESSNDISIATGDANQDVGGSNSGNISVLIGKPDLIGAGTPGTLLLGMKTSSGYSKLLVRDLALNYEQTSPPTVSAESALGSTGSATITTGSSDNAFRLTLTPGGTGITTGTQATVTRKGKACSTGSIVTYGANNTNASVAIATLGISMAGSTTTIVVAAPSLALTTGQAYIFDVHTSCF